MKPPPPAFPKTEMRDAFPALPPPAEFSGDIPPFRFWNRSPFVIPAAPLYWISRIDSMLFLFAGLNTCR